MKKKLLSLVVGGMLFAPSLSFAIGLGSVRTYSNLNEQLSAEIPVLSIRQKGKMSVGLAPNKMFSQRGIARSGALSNLRFSLVKRNGRTYVRLGSSKQIDTPYLNFILELKSPEGTVYREYAIFLDPAKPGAKKRKAPPIQKAKPTRQSAATTSKPQKTTSQPVDSGLNFVKGKAGRYGPVKRGETLWSIAKKTRPSDKISIQRMVAAIKQANPRTLARGLQAGSTIRIPAIQGYVPYAGKKPPTQTKAAKPIKTKPITDADSVGKIVSSIHQDSKAKADTSTEVKITETKPATDSKSAVVLPVQTEKVPTADSQTETETKAQQLADGITEIVTTTPTEKLDSVTDSITVADDEKTEVDIKVTDTEAATEELTKTAEAQSTETTATTVSPETETVSEPAEKTASEPTTDKKEAAATPPAKTADTPTVTKTDDVNRELPVELLGGLAALVAGVGGLAYLRKRRKNKQASDVILLGDETDLQEMTALDTDGIDEAVVEASADTSDNIDEVVAAIEAQETSETIEDTAEKIETVELSEFAEKQEDTGDVDSIEVKLDSPTDFDADSTFADDDIMAEFDLESDLADFDNELDLADVSQTTNIAEEIVLEESKEETTAHTDKLSLETDEGSDLAVNEIDNLDTSGIDLDKTVAEFDIESEGDVVDFDFEDALAELDELQETIGKQSQGEELQPLEFSTTETETADSDESPTTAASDSDDDSDTFVPDSTHDALAEFDLDSDSESDEDFEQTLADLDELSNIDLTSGDEGLIESDVTPETTDLMSDDLSLDLDTDSEDDTDFEQTLADLDEVSDFDLTSDDESISKVDTANDLADAVAELDREHSDEIDEDIFADFDELSTDLTDFDESAFESDDSKETIDFDLDEPEKSDTATADKKAKEDVEVQVEQPVAADLGKKAKGLAESVAASGLALTGAAAAATALSDEQSDDIASATDEDDENQQELTEEHIADIKMKLDLATTFMSLPNYVRAKQLLAEVVRDGSDEQIEKAMALLKQIS